MASGFQEVSSADFLSDPQTHRQSQMSRLEKLVYSFITPRVRCTLFSATHTPLSPPLNNNNKKT